LRLPGGPHGFPHPDHGEPGLAHLAHVCLEAGRGLVLVVVRGAEEHVVGKLGHQGSFREQGVMRVESVGGSGRGTGSNLVGVIGPTGGRTARRSVSHPFTAPATSPSSSCFRSRMNTRI